MSEFLPSVRRPLSLHDKAIAEADVVFPTPPFPPTNINCASVACKAWGGRLMASESFDAFKADCTTRTRSLQNLVRGGNF